MENLETLVKNYRPPVSAVELVKKMQIALIVGISGAGKDAIKDKLLKTGEYIKIITTIPRAMRPHETEGVDYYFINDEIVRQNLLNHKYFEAKMVHGRVYGTTIAELERIAAQNKIALADVEVQGVDEYHAAAGDNLKAIFIVPPDYETWQARWKLRGAAVDDDFAKRTETAIMELEYALNREYYYFVVNDDLDEAAESADQIIHGKTANYDGATARRIAEKLLEKIVDSRY